MRPIYEIAADIRRDWRNVYYGAKPYLDAMALLGGIHDKYMAEDASDIVTRFLVNAGTWRGDTARRVKQELLNMLKAAR